MRELAEFGERVWACDGRVCYEPVRASGVYLTIDFALIQHTDVSGVSCVTCVHRHAEHWHGFRRLLPQPLSTPGFCGPVRERMGGLFCADVSADYRAEISHAAAGLGGRRLEGPVCSAAVGYERAANDLREIV